MADKNKEYYGFKKDTPKTVPKVSKLSNSEECIAQSSPLSLQSPLEFQETRPSGTPSLFISHHLKTSQEGHLSGKSRFDISLSRHVGFSE